jgi:hypothetical protein
MMNRLALVSFDIRDWDLIHHSSFVIRDFSDSLTPSSYKGPLIPPSFRTRQKWIANNSDAANGIAMQCRI